MTGGGWDIPESYKSQILDELNSMDAYPTDNRYDGPLSQDYQYQNYPDYEELSDKLSVPTRSDDSLMSAAGPKYQQDKLVQSLKTTKDFAATLCSQPTATLQIPVQLGTPLLMAALKILRTRLNSAVAINQDKNASAIPNTCLIAQRKMRTEEQMILLQ